MINAIILIAGAGTRFGSERPKQFLSVANKPLFIYTLEAFVNHHLIDAVYLVAQEEEFYFITSELNKFKLADDVKLIQGGKTRQASVSNAIAALEQLNTSDDDLVLIHDGARPLVSEAIISENIKNADFFGATTTAIKSRNTLATSLDDKLIYDIPDRSKYFEIQTPQTFKFEYIARAHEYARGNNLENVSDDTQLVKAIGRPVSISEGSSLNFKITTKEDLSLFEAVLKLIGK